MAKNKFDFNFLFLKLQDGTWTYATDETFPPG